MILKLVIERILEMDHHGVNRLLLTSSNLTGDEFPSSSQILNSMGITTTAGSNLPCPLPIGDALGYVEQYQSWALDPQKCRAQLN
jgi:hypothetical protein